jgi:ribosomal protein S12 methylthiotransferase accessory factor
VNETKNHGTAQAIIFVGPSIPLDIAKRALPNGEYRPPIKRGDLDTIESGQIVGIIDGVFSQTLAISPGEIRDAIGRGVVVYGAASMGALRAAEIPQVHGIGKIFEMYRYGAIERDDEVALLFDPSTFKPLTVPLINLRYGVERLVRSATLSKDVGDALIKACSELHYRDRTYTAIFDNSRLAHNRDREEIAQLLSRFDLKREDALSLIETLAQVRCSNGNTTSAAAAPPFWETSTTRVRATEDPTAPILIWESGDWLKFEDLIRFLKITKLYQGFARNALGRFALAGTAFRCAPSVAAVNEENVAQTLLDAARLIWGWESPEEAHVTMRDLGLGLVDLSSSLEAEAATERIVSSFAMSASRVYAKALRSELWMNNLALKREAMRYGALRYFARKGEALGSPTDVEIADAKRTICRLTAAMQWPAVCRELDQLGVGQDDLTSFIQDLALARRAAWPVVRALDSNVKPRPPGSRAESWRLLGLSFESAIKAEGSSRFNLLTSDALAATDKIAKQINIVRVGHVGELDTLGIHVAQAFGQRSGWSASFSSGKAETRDGARIGSIMEEVEIFAQDAFFPHEAVRAPFASRSPACEMIDPMELGLPYDTRYSPSLEIAWTEWVDIARCKKVLAPTAAVTGERVDNDIYYSPRLGGKIFSSSGLGSGFSLAEAALHAAAECVERHAVRLAELEIDNPGGVGVRQFWFVDLQSLPEGPTRIVGKYQEAGMCVRILNITSDIAVPTFYARVFEDPFESETSTSSDGFACHPNPAVAVNMALLEAAQTKAGVIAGGREDYSLQARSLGRHERPRTLVPKSQVFWFGNDRPTRALEKTAGFDSRDVLEELEWLIDRVQDGGYEHILLANFTCAQIHPAYAVRILIPGIETTNPLHAGARGRATLIRDLLPRQSNASN